MFTRKPKTPLTLEESIAKDQRAEARYARINKVTNRILLGAGAGFLIFEGARRGAIRGAGDFTVALVEEIEKLVGDENKTPSE